MNRWKRLNINEDIPVSRRNLVTRLIKDTNGNGKANATLAYPGWNYNNNRVIAYMEIRNAAEDYTGWRSIYRGNEPPQTKGWYLVTMQSIAGNQVLLGELYYEAKVDIWLAVPDNYEVLAYRPYPKPYKQKSKDAA